MNLISYEYLVFLLNFTILLIKNAAFLVTDLFSIEYFLSTTFHFHFMRLIFFALQFVYFACFFVPLFVKGSLYVCKANLYFDRFLS